MLYFIFDGTNNSNITEVVRKAIEQELKQQNVDELNVQGILENTLDVDEAAKLLRIAKQTLYTLTSKKKIPFYKKGKKILFNRLELDAWLSKSKQEELPKLKNTTSTDLEDNQLNG